MLIMAISEITGALNRAIYQLAGIETGITIDDPDAITPENVAAAIALFPEGSRFTPDEVATHLSPPLLQHTPTAHALMVDATHEHLNEIWENPDLRKKLGILKKQSQPSQEVVVYTKIK
jgi:hypothetical protein